MGNTHFKSNIVGKAGTETISNFASVGGTAIAGTTVTATGAAQGATVVATSYVKIGSNKYIFQGVDGTQASIMAIVEALVATPLSKTGSLYLGDTVGWRLISNNAATKI